MSFKYRRSVVLAAVLSLSVLVPGGFRMASAQPPAAAPAAPAPGARRAPRVNALNEALKSLDLTAEQKNKIKEIRANARKDMDAIPNRRSPEGQAKQREVNAKIATDVKASLPADLQAKFQTAYDAAEKKSADQAKEQAVTAGLAEFKRPLETLTLTTDQQAKIDPIAKASYEKVIAVRQDQTLKGKQRTEKIETIVTDMKTQVRPLLTAEQQTKFDTLDLAPKPARGGGGGGRRRNGANAAPVTPPTP